MSSGFDIFVDGQYYPAERLDALDRYLMQRSRCRFTFAPSAAHPQVTVGQEVRAFLLGERQDSIASLTGPGAQVSLQATGTHPANCVIRFRVAAVNFTAFQNAKLKIFFKFSGSNQVGDGINFEIFRSGGLTDTQLTTSRAVAGSSSDFGLITDSVSTTVDRGSISDPATTEEDHGGLPGATSSPYEHTPQVGDVVVISVYNDTVRVYLDGVKRHEVTAPFTGLSYEVWIAQDMTLEDFEVYEGPPHDALAFCGRVQVPTGTDQDSIGDIRQTVEAVDLTGALEEVVVENYEIAAPDATSDPAASGDVVRALLALPLSADGNTLADEGITEGVVEDGPPVYAFKREMVTAKAFLDELHRLTGYLYEIDCDGALSWRRPTTRPAPYALSESLGTVNGAHGAAATSIAVTGMTNLSLIDAGTEVSIDGRSYTTTAEATITAGAGTLQITPGLYAGLSGGEAVAVYVGRDYGLTWTEQLLEFANVAYGVFGVGRSARYRQTFTAVASQKNFTTTHQIDEIALLTVEGVAKTFAGKGREGDDAAEAIYYPPDSIEAFRDGGFTTRSLSFATGLSSGDEVVIEYYSRGVLRMVLTDYESIQARADVESGSGRHERIFQLGAVTSRSHGYELLRGELDRRSAVPVRVDFATARPGLRPGDLLPIARAEEGLAGDWLVHFVGAASGGAGVAYRVEAYSGPPDPSPMAFLAEQVGKPASLLGSEQVLPVEVPDVFYDAFTGAASGGLALRAADRDASGLGWADPDDVWTVDGSGAAVCAATGSDNVAYAQAEVGAVVPDYVVAARIALAAGEEPGLVGRLYVQGGSLYYYEARCIVDDNEIKLYRVEDGAETLIATGEAVLDAGASVLVRMECVRSRIVVRWRFLTDDDWRYACEEDEVEAAFEDQVGAGVRVQSGDTDTAFDWARVRLAFYNDAEN